VKLSSNRWMSRTSARSGRDRAMILMKGRLTAETSLLIGTGQFGRRSARRDSGFTKQGMGPASGHLSFWNRRYEASVRAEAKRGADVAVPRPDEYFAEALALPLGRDHDVHSPRGLHFLALHAQGAPASSRTGPMMLGPLARDPDLGLLARVVGVFGGTAIPSAAGARLGSVVAEDAPVEGLDGTAVLGPVTIDVSHHYVPALANRYSMLLMSASCVSGLSRSRRASRAGHPPHGTGHVQVLTHDPQAGPGNLSAQPLHAHLLEQVILLGPHLAGRPRMKRVFRAPAP
jgi:hypothetical protein